MIVVMFSGVEDRLTLLGVGALVGWLGGVVIFFSSPKLSAWEGVAASVITWSSVAIGGETNSIYLGVKIKTKDMRKKARRVFLSIL